MFGHALATRDARQVGGFALTVELGIVVQRSAYADHDRVVQGAHPVSPSRLILGMQVFCARTSGSLPGSLSRLG